MESIKTTSPFELGDIVKLASGGPAMRVIGFSPNDRVWCDWESSFAGRREEGSFAPESLNKVT